MRIPSDRLEHHLRQGLRSCYTVLGEEPLLALEASDLLRHAAHQNGFTEREVLTVEPGFDWSRFTHACHSGSLFGDKKLVELRLPSGKPGVEGARHLEALRQTPGGDLMLLLNLPALDYRTQQSGWFKALETQGILVVASQVSRDQLPGWIAQRLSLQGQRASPDALAFLAEQVEGNLLAAHQEIQKLALLFPVGPIADDALRETVLQVGRYAPSDLSVALLEGNLHRYLRTLRGLQAEGEPLPLILWALVEDIRAILHLGHARKAGRPFSAACREARVWGPRQKQLEPLITQITSASCEQALASASRVDRMIKGVETGDPWEALLEMALDFRPDCLSGSNRLASQPRHDGY